MEAAPMQAAQVENYGWLVVREVGQAQPAEGELLVRVHAISLNAVDWYAFSGRPYTARLVMGLRNPQSTKSGSDFAGRRRGGARGVDTLAPGDAVFGAGAAPSRNTWSRTRPSGGSRANLSFDEAAACPHGPHRAAGATRSRGGPGRGARARQRCGGRRRHLRRPDRKGLGASVDAVCSSRNVEQARGSAQSGSTTTRRGLHARRRQLRRAVRQRRQPLLAVDAARARSEGKIVLVGGPRTRVLGPLGHIVRVMLAAKMAGLGRLLHREAERRRPRGAA